MSIEAQNVLAQTSIASLAAPRNEIIQEKRVEEREREILMRMSNSDSAIVVV